MKKWLILGLLACMLFGVTACGGNEDVSSSNDGSSPAVSVENSEESEESKEDESAENTQTYCKVTFDTDGGNAIESAQVEKGEKLTKPADPTKSSADCEYEFLGWYNGETAWDFDKDVVTQDITLTAKWKKSDSYSEPFLPKN